MNVYTSVVAALLLLGATAPQLVRAQLVEVPPPTLDPTGTWEGEITCRTQIDGTPSKEVFQDQTVQISPGGGGFVLKLTGPGLSFDFHYRGSFTPDAKKPAERGAAGFVECHTSTAIPGTYNEVLSATFKGKAEEAQLEGTSAYNQVPDGFQAGVCRWSFKRTSTENPHVLSCPLGGKL